MKRVRYFFEAIVVKIALWFFGSLSVQAASNIAASLAKIIGKKISVQKLAYKNLSRSMPHLSQNKKDKIIDEMWDNLGRIVGEFPHVAKLSSSEIDKVIKISDSTKGNIQELAQSDKGGIIFSGHIGNWEVGPKYFLKHGLRVSTVYRSLNNPYVENMTASLRDVDMIEKSSSGNRKIIEVIKRGGFVIILADQKVSEGEKVKFFYDDAITTTSIARIALKYNVPLIPARSIRVGNAFKFCIEVEKSLAIERSEDINYDILSLTRKINCKLEEWINQYPAQWFWVHNRWKK